MKSVYIAIVALLLSFSGSYADSFEKEHAKVIASCTQSFCEMHARSCTRLCLSIGRHLVSISRDPGSVGSHATRLSFALCSLKARVRQGSCGASCTEHVAELSSLVARGVVRGLARFFERKLIENLDRIRFESNHFVAGSGFLDKLLLALRMNGPAVDQADEIVVRQGMNSQLHHCAEVFSDVYHYHASIVWHEATDSQLREVLKRLHAHACALRVGDVAEPVHVTPALAILDLSDCDEYAVDYARMIRRLAGDACLQASKKVPKRRFSSSMLGGIGSLGAVATYAGGLLEYGKSGIGAGFRLGEGFLSRLRDGVRTSTGILGLGTRPFENVGEAWRALNVALGELINEYGLLAFMRSQFFGASSVSNETLVRRLTDAQGELGMRIAQVADHVVNVVVMLTTFGVTYLLWCNVAHAKRKHAHGYISGIDDTLNEQGYAASSSAKYHDGMLCYGIVKLEELVASSIMSIADKVLLRDIIEQLRRSDLSAQQKLHILNVRWWQKRSAAL